jgi:hypothetical protein
MHLREYFPSEIRLHGEGVNGIGGAVFVRSGRGEHAEKSKNDAEPDARRIHESLVPQRHLEFVSHFLHSVQEVR